MVAVLIVVVVVGLGVALYEILTSRRGRRADTRAQLDALSRVVEPQRRRDDRRSAATGIDGTTVEPPQSPQSPEE